MLTRLVIFVLLRQMVKATENKLLLIGGEPSGENGKVELIDLSQSDDGSCATRLQDIPLPFDSVGTFIDNKVMVCGGTVDEIFQAQDTNKCYNYNPADDSWIETDSMLEKRSAAAAVQLSPTKWWITGGNGDLSVPFLISTELFTVGKGFSTHVDLPERMAYHNLVKINDTHIFLIQGEAAFVKVWMFDVVAKLFTRLPSPNLTATHSYSGLVTNQNGDKEVVMGSGFQGTTTQIFNLNAQAWRRGPSIFDHQNLLHCPTVSHGDTFLVVGGINGNYYKDTIYQYEVEGNGSWSLLPIRLSSPRSKMVALWVPDDFL